MKTPRLIFELISQALDDDIFEVTTKSVSETDIGHRHIRVLQNGSPNPALVHHLVSDPKLSVVAFVERDADIDAAARALVTARFAQGGKSLYAPDVVLVNEWVKKEFLRAVVQQQIAFAAEDDAPQKSKKSANSELLNEAAKEGLSHVVSSGPGGTILDVEDRWETKAYTFAKDRANKRQELVAFKAKDHAILFVGPCSQEHGRCH